MPRQRGLIKIEGTLGDVTFFKTQDGYMVKEKSAVTASRIATDPNFQRTRENNAEFGRAGKATKLIRKAFSTVVGSGKDRRMSSRLMREVVKVVKADATNLRGQRRVLDAETELLKGFDFNINASLHDSLGAEFSTQITRTTGVLEVNVPSFIPADTIVPPIEATHFKLVMAGAEINFENEVYNLKSMTSATLPIDKTPTALITLSTTLTPNSTDPLFLLFGIQFIQEMNSEYYPLKNGVYNAMYMADVLGV